MAGLADTNTIDLVAQDAHGRYMLVMVETRPWGAHPDQAAQLREKINTYAGFILDGSLAQHYPEIAGQPVYIQLDCVETPRGEIAAIVQRASHQLETLDIGFRINIRRRSSN